MPREVFVDTGAWVALADADDSLHRVAVDYYHGILAEAMPLVTTNLVIAEAYIILRRAGGHAPATLFLRSVRQTTRLRKVFSDYELETIAENILGRYTDQDFSFTDAVSFAAMRQSKIEEAFAFDHHFQTAGFIIQPARH